MGTGSLGGRCFEPGAAFTSTTTPVTAVILWPICILEMGFFFITRTTRREFVYDDLPLGQTDARAFRPAGSVHLAKLSRIREPYR